MNEPRAGVGPLTFTRLRALSFTHSCVYTALLVCAFALGGPQPETFILGLTHGLMWIGHVAGVPRGRARLRIVSLRLAVYVVVLGGIGPFFGSYEFVRESRREEPSTGRPHRAEGPAAPGPRPRNRCNCWRSTPSHRTLE